MLRIQRKAARLSPAEQRLELLVDRQAVKVDDGSFPVCTRESTEARQLREKSSHRVPREGRVGLKDTKAET